MIERKRSSFLPWVGVVLAPFLIETAGLFLLKGLPAHAGELVGWVSVGCAVVVGLIFLFWTNLPRLFKICVVPVYVLVMVCLLYFYIFFVGQLLGGFVVIGW